MANANVERLKAAQQIVKDEMKRQGIRISWVAWYDINRAAQEVLRSNPSLVDDYLAKQNSRAILPIS